MLRQKSKKGGHGLLGAFGLPFFFGANYSELQSEADLYAALVRQISRFSTLGAEMFESVSGDDGRATDTPDPAQPSSSTATDVDMINSAATATTDPSGTDLKPVPSAAGNLAPVRNLFEISVNSIADRTGQLPVASSTVSSLRCDTKLSDRIAQQSVMPGSQRLPGSFEQTIDADEELDKLYGQLNGGDTSRVEAEPENKPASTTASPQPILQTGDMIVCDWPEASYQHFFGKNSTQAFDVFSAKSVSDDKSDSSSGSNKLSLDSCLDEFSKEEQLDDQNTWSAYTTNCPRAMLIA